MSQVQVRITKNDQIQTILDSLREKFQLTSDAELFKMALGAFYNQYTQESKAKFKTTLETLSTKSKKYGDEYLAQKGLKRENMSDEDLLNLLNKDV